MIDSQTCRIRLSSHHTTEVLSPQCVQPYTLSSCNTTNILPCQCPDSSTLSFCHTTEILSHQRPQIYYPKSQAFAIQPTFCLQPYSPTFLRSHPSCMQQGEEVFQLQQQHWRLADASWSLITLLQKAAATLASLSPQGPGLIRRLTPTPQEGSTKGSAALPLAGTAEQSGELVCMLENARRGCCTPKLLYSCFIHCLHA